MSSKESGRQPSLTGSSVADDANHSSDNKLKTAPPDTGAPVTSQISSSGPPPDGGLAAWLIVVGGFIIFFNTWGILNTFAVYQTYYESGKLFETTSSNIGWVGSIQSFLLQLTGLIAGPLYDRGFLRSLLIVGSFLVVFGHMMLSLCTNYWQVLLAQGICVGIGSGLLFAPTVSLVPTYFSSKMGLAIGIAAAGSSMGGVIYPIVLSRLIDQIGFPWAVRVVGLIALGLFVIPLLTLKMRVRAAKPRAVIDWSAFTDAPFMMFTGGLFLAMIGFTVLIFYVSYFPANRGFTDTTMAFYVVAILNAGSIFGRVIPNAISDHAGPFNTLIPSTFLTGVTLLCLLAVHDEVGIIVEAVVTGFLSGILIGLPPVCFRVLTADKSMIGTRVGQGYALVGFGMLIGGPGGGGILGTSEPLNWTGLWIFAGVMACAGSMVFLLVRVVKYGFALNIKA